MNTRTPARLALTLVLVVSAFSLAALPAPEKPKPAPDLAWIAGTWSGEMWGGVFTAHYGLTGDGRVVGYSRHTRGEQESFYEFEVLDLTRETPTYTPYPGGRRAETFTLTGTENTRAVFEMPEKDYPTRVVFERVGGKRLVITLDDPHGGGDKVEVFDLARQ